MRQTLAHVWKSLARWAGGKGSIPEDRFLPPVPPAYRSPTMPYNLLGELRNTAYTCATLNAAACAAHPPRLYVATRPGDAPPRCRVKALPPAAQERLREVPHLHAHTRPARHLEEVTDHPILTLFRSVNEEHNAWDLWELTTLYQEVMGSAYWLLENGPFGVPVRVWPLPAQAVRTVRQPGSPSLVDGYDLLTTVPPRRLEPAEVIAFKYPDPRDPYGPGLAPLRACHEHVRLDAEYTALKRAQFANHALPSAIIAPEEMLPPEEARRIEAAWNARFQGGGQGGVLVSEARLKVHLLSHAFGDLAALAEAGASKETIANAFGVPPPYLFRETNLANMQAAERFHTAFTLRPRLMRRDEKLNERLVPLYDPTGRLFLASDDPRPEDRERALREQEVHLRLGVRTVNEVRAGLGLPPVPWGDAPPGRQPGRPPGPPGARS